MDVPKSRRSLVLLAGVLCALLALFLLWQPRVGPRAPPLPSKEGPGSIPLPEVPGDAAVDPIGRAGVLNSPNQFGVCRID